MLALPAMPLRFRPAPLAAPLSLPLDSSRVARMMYMCVWHAKMHEACIRARAIAYDSFGRRLG